MTEISFRARSGLDRKWLRVATIALLLGLLAGTSGAEEHLRLVTGNGAPFATAGRDGFLDLIIAEAFWRIGILAEVRTHQSSERALINANNGDDDGVAARIRGLEARYPNLVIVPEKLFDNDFVAYALDRNFATTDWDSLKQNHVGFIRGWQIFEANLSDAREITRARDARQLFELLQQGRIEIALYERWQGLWYARQSGLPIRMLRPPLARQEMFAYLHKKHSGLAPRVASALADMKRDGSYERIFGSTLAWLEAAEPKP
jgi:polar amino acid transport system substrate-binding protein